MNVKDYLKFDIKNIKLRHKHKIITLGYAAAILFAFILSLTNNNYVEASVSPNERLDYLMIENNVVNNLSNPETIYPQSSVENIKSLFDSVTALSREKKQDKTIIVESGDTLISILANLGLTQDTANDVFYKLKNFYDPTSLKAGQKLEANLTLNSQTNEITALNSLTILPRAGERVIIARGEDGTYSVNKEKDELVEEINSATGVIDGTLSHSMLRQGVPVRVVNNFIKIFSYSVDFRRDLHKGDKFEIVYENKIAPDGSVVQSGDILYAGLILRRERIGLYRYEDKNGSTDYFNEKGMAMKKSLYRMPLNRQARISSPFGKRYHPILKLTKIHWGVDYAIASGTPILAGGDGVVQAAKWNGAYGNYVKIRHNSEFATAYGHMKGFAKGIRPGVRVKQGQVIGYVGSTGRSTGPHVHYEVIQNGRRVNPRTIKAATGENLSGQKLKQFKQRVAEIKSSYKTMFAQNEAQKIASKQ